jgi:hypothetical protein
MAAPIPEMSDLRSFSPRQVIADAARRTGADFDFLVRTAARESNFDAGAQARTSSAAGMFQFIEQTWLSMVQRHGEKHGLADEAAMIERGANGRLTIADGAEQARVLDLRFDPAMASVMAGELAADNAAILRSKIGREPSTGELYAAHFLGAHGAADLINAAGEQPQAKADALFPQAAAANRPVFYRDGQALDVASLLARLTGEAAMVEAPEQGRLPAADGGGADPKPYRPGVAGYAAFSTAGGVLSPALVELLASLDMPAPAKRNDKS